MTTFSRPVLRIAFRLALGCLVAATASCGEPKGGKAAKATSPASGEWEDLWDGRTLAGWKPSGFETEGPVKVVDPFRDGTAAILIQKGTTLSGITSTRGPTLPRVNYELSLEAMRVEGSDFFCGLTFPVGKSACTFVVGGWGGMVVGLSSIDGLDASENDTSASQEFKDNRWYRIRVRVTAEKIEAWIDSEQFVDLVWKDRKIDLRPGDIQQALPLGVSTYMTSAAVRDIRIRRIDPTSAEGRKD